MMNNGTMADMLQEAMQKKEGPKDTFNMRGGKASPVKYEEDTSREYVMYESPNGEEVKVYGGWNELRKKNLNNKKQIHKIQNHSLQE